MLSNQKTSLLTFYQLSIIKITIRIFFEKTYIIISILYSNTCNSQSHAKGNVKNLIIIEL